MKDFGAKMGKEIERKYLLVGDEWTCNGISIDTRSVGPGDLFVALPGDPGPGYSVSQRSDRDGHHFVNAAVANFEIQDPPIELGIDRLEFWVPSRRPEGMNIPMSMEPVILVLKVSYQIRQSITS